MAPQTVRALHKADIRFAFPLPFDDPALRGKERRFFYAERALEIIVVFKFYYKRTSNTFFGFKSSYDTCA